MEHRKSNRLVHLSLAISVGSLLFLFGACGSGDTTSEDAGADGATSETPTHGDEATAHGDEVSPHGDQAEGTSPHGEDHGSMDSSTPSEAAVNFVSGMERNELIREGESHFASLRQLTNGGENAEAYWSWDSSQLIYQWTRREGGCDQIYTIPAKGGEPTLVSTGKGRCTCAYFTPNDERIVFSSTHLGGEECPPTPDHSQGYVWPIYDTYDVFTANPDGTGLKQLTEDEAYDAEATVGPDGSIVFTSTRDGDLDLYSMSADGSKVTRLTDQPGYDGGAFYSPDGSMICFRASRPQGQELADYQRLLAQGLVRPGQLDIFVMDADGSNVKQLTDNGAANFCPFFHPSGEKLIFASNMGDPRGRNFDLYMVGLDGGEPERITFEGTFDGFPMFSPDGRYLAFSSNRGAERPRETNVFIAEWRD